ncbi:MAG: hypothetical protein SFW36_00985 [Leptolyngbyaceae cyanobacterium bins.59]|nr:hypothetical protein [Leptolyngbyaceae cyanobacterium bins.59]
MLHFRWLKPLSSLGLEFWLPLPLLGLVFWIGSSVLTDRVLSRAYRSDNRLQADTQLDTPSKIILAVQVDIFRNRGVSRVTVRTTNTALKALVFEFPFINVAQLEQATSQQLGMPIERLRPITRYRVLLDP